MKKAIIRIGFNYGYQEEKYIKAFPEHTGFKVLTKDGMFFETKGHEFEDTENTIHLYADDIVTESYLNDGHYRPVCLKITENNVPHIMPYQISTDMQIYDTISNPSDFTVVARLQNASDYTLRIKDDKIAEQPMEMEINNAFVKFTGDVVMGYYNGTAMIIAETENKKFSDNEDTVLLHEYTDTGIFNSAGRKVEVTVNNNKIRINILPERDYFDDYYDF